MIPAHYIPRIARDVMLMRFYRILFRRFYYYFIIFYYFATHNELQAE